MTDHGDTTERHAGTHLSSCTVLVVVEDLLGFYAGPPSKLFVCVFLLCRGTLWQL